MSINVSEVIWTIVCFFALLFVLKKFLFDPLVRFMEARQASIDEGHEKARQAQQQNQRAERQQAGQYHPPDLHTMLLTSNPCV